MKLDKRIKEGKRPLTCFDVEIANQFIGKKGYFSHYIDNYADLKNTVLGTLGSTGDTFHESFCCTEETFDNYYYEFFLPAEWVKEPKKKYRPFSLNEFTELYAISDVVTYRIKDCEVIEQSMFIGCQSSNDGDTPGNGYVVIGNCKYSLKELFNNYELQYLNHWQPFGVVDEGE